MRRPNGTNLLSKITAHGDRSPLRNLAAGVDELVISEVLYNDKKFLVRREHESGDYVSNQSLDFQGTI